MKLIVKALPGDTVLLGKPENDDQITAIVTGIYYNGYHIKYECCWFSDGIRYSEYFSDFEIMVETVEKEIGFEIKR